MLSNTLPETELLQFEKSFILHPHYHPKITGQTLKNKQKNIYACIQKIMIMITTDHDENEDENEK